MAKNYSITIINNSQANDKFCIYQEVPENRDGTIIPLAWFSMRIRPQTRTTFQWKNEYEFAWSKTGVLKPGVIFDAEQMISANPPHQNTITFAQYNNHYQFLNAKSGQYVNVLTVITEDLSGDSSGYPSIGIANSGSTIFACQAQSLTTTSFFTPPQRYRIARGSYEQSQVLDIGAIIDFVEVNFLTNQFDMTVTLNADMTWNVQPG